MWFLPKSIREIGEVPGTNLFNFIQERPMPAIGDPEYFEMKKRAIDAGMEDADVMLNTLATERATALKDLEKERFEKEGILSKTKLLSDTLESESRKRSRAEAGLTEATSALERSRRELDTTRRNLDSTVSKLREQEAAKAGSPYEVKKRMLREARNREVRTYRRPKTMAEANILRNSAIARDTSYLNTLHNESSMYTPGLDAAHGMVREWEGQDVNTLLDPYIVGLLRNLNYYQ